MKQNIILIGFMGTGKSTISKALHEKTGWPEVDMDRWIVEKESMSINEIFEKYGEPCFREKETQALETVLQESGQIVSCGGGAVLKTHNVELMKNRGSVVLLTAKPETIYERVKDDKTRPILNGNMNVEYIAGLMEKRNVYYEAAADIRIATDGKSAEQICEEIFGNLQ